MGKNLIENDEEGYMVQQCGQTVHVELWYPRVDPGKVQAVTVGLCDVRAADDVRISYDFERDGWSIQQGSGDDIDDPDWQEVAFVQAWARDDARKAQEGRSDEREG